MRRVRRNAVSRMTPSTNRITEPRRGCHGRKNRNGRRAPLVRKGGGGRSPRAAGGGGGPSRGGGGGVGGGGARGGGRVGLWGGGPRQWPPAVFCGAASLRQAPVSGSR